MNECLRQVQPSKQLHWLGLKLHVRDAGSFDARPLDAGREASCKTRKTAR